MNISRHRRPTRGIPKKQHQSRKSRKLAAKPPKYGGDSISAVKPLKRGKPKLIESASQAYDVAASVTTEAYNAGYTIDMSLVGLGETFDSLVQQSIGVPVRAWKQACKYMLETLRQQSDMLGRETSLEYLAETSLHGVDSLRLSDIQPMHAKATIDGYAYASLIELAGSVPARITRIAVNDLQGFTRQSHADATAIGKWRKRNCKTDSKGNHRIRLYSQPIPISEHVVSVLDTLYG